MRHAGSAATLVGALVALCATSAAAHDGLHQEIAALTRELEARPRDARLLLRRAELYRLHGQWNAALADLASAEVLEPRLDGLELCGARVFRDAGVLPAAQRLLERHLELRPDDPAALLLGAELAARRGLVEEAVRDLDRALARLGSPEPDHFLLRAELLAGTGPRGVERALAGLDEGLARLGPVAALELRAIELERERGRFDDALARLDGILARSPRAETWLARRAEILLEAERTAEAWTAFGEARLALASLPLARRSTAAARALEAELECRLTELGARLAAEGRTREEPDTRSQPLEERTR